MNYIIAGLIGILVWQIIGLIVYEASGEKEEIFAWVILFVPVIICNGLGYIYHKLYFAWYRFCVPAKYRLLYRHIISFARF